MTWTLRVACCAGHDGQWLKPHAASCCLSIFSVYAGVAAVIRSGWCIMSCLQYKLLTSCGAYLLLPAAARVYNLLFCVSKVHMYESST